MTAPSHPRRTGESECRPRPIPRYHVRDLTKGSVCAQIELDGQVYTLRITRAGKLILTK
jgi:hemin uptake protein HemP